MTVPDMGQVGADLYDAVAPLTWADSQVEYHLAHFCAANGLQLEEVAALVRTDDEGNDGWTAFASPKRCPDDYLYTLAVWAGVRFPRRMSLGDLRALIGPQAPGLWRGTKAAILASVQRYLTSGATIYFEERADGDAYKLRIFTYDGETLDEAAIVHELRNQIPAGLVVDYEVRVGQTYDQLAASMASYDQVTATYPTYDDVTYSLPPEATTQPGGTA
jgi:hypothetical protein